MARSMHPLQVARRRLLGIRTASPTDAMQEQSMTWIHVKRRAYPSSLMSPPFIQFTITVHATERTIGPKNNPTIP
jgi:hypothetical protein